MLLQLLEMVCFQLILLLFIFFIHITADILQLFRYLNRQISQYEQTESALFSDQENFQALRRQVSHQLRNMGQKQSEI